MSGCWLVPLQLLAPASPSTPPWPHSANGSVLQELSNPEHAGLTFCPLAIAAILQQVHNNGCPQLTTADAIQVCVAQHLMPIRVPVPIRHPRPRGLMLTLLPPA